jgi:hypothetical protein
MAHESTRNVILSAPRAIGDLRIKPKEHPSLLLGTFTDENPPAGFSISIHPNPSPANSVTTRVATSGKGDKYKLVLHVTNNSARTVGVHVNQL